jgi:hypothetical protein
LQIITNVFKGFRKYVKNMQFCFTHVPEGVSYAIIANEINKTGAEIKD